MKQLLSIMFMLACVMTPCHAQFGTLSKIYNGVKTVKQVKKARDKALENQGNKKVKDVIDTTSVNYKKARAELQQKLQEDPEYQKLLELQNDSVAARKYFEEKYGSELPKPNLDSKAYDKAIIMSSLTEDPVFKKIMAEQRQPTMQEATYLNEKYGTSFEYKGIEAYNDSIGVFAHLDGKLKPMSVTKSMKITEERPVPDFGQNEIKQYVQDFIAFLKKPLADKEIIDSVQNYIIYNKPHSDYQFKRTAKFTIYTNPETRIDKLTVNDIQLRKIDDFMEPIDPKNIFVFKIHKGLDCRFMEYMYSKITYKQSELADYVCKRLVDDGYIDANINKKISDDQLFRAMDKLKFQFKVEKLLKFRQDKDKYLFANTVPAAENVNIKSAVRKIANVTALEITLNAEPGEYAFIIRNPEVEEDFKKEKFDFSLLSQGAFFFTIQ